MNSIWARLLLVMLIALLPALGFQAYTESEARRIRHQLVEDEAMRLIHLIDAEQIRILEGAEQALRTLSSTPTVQDNVPQQCQRLLANLVHQSPRYNVVAVIGLDGHIRCASVPSDPTIDLSDRQHFRRALQAGGFALGDYAVGRVSGKPSIHAAIPFLDRKGAIAGVIDLAIDPEWLREQLERLRLPKGAIAVIADRNGTILARRPDGARFVGTSIPAADRILLQGDEVGIAATKDQDGRGLLAAYSPPDADPKGLLVEIALDQEATFAAVEGANRTGLILILAGAGFGLAGTILIGRRLIRQPLRRLIGVAERWRTGDLTVRTGLRPDNSDLGRLAAAFDAMATALEARERALRTALESTTDSVMVLDRSWRYTYINDRAMAQLRITRDLLGRVMWDEYPEFADSAFGQAYREAMVRGVPVHVCAPSTLRDCWFDAHAYPSKEGLTVFFRDVTEERRTAAALQQSELLFRATFEQAAVGMSQVALDGRWLSVNDKLCAITGYARDELLAMAHQDITHPDDAEASHELIRKLLAGEPLPDRFEKRYLRKGGDVVWVNITVALLRDSEGRPERFISVTEDISQRKLAETALRESEKLAALGHLAGGIAHDFNNILQAVQTSTTLIQRHMADAAMLRECTSLILTSTARGTTVTRRLLTFARQGDLCATRIEPAALLDGLRDILAHTLASPVTVRLDIQPDLPLLLADQGQLETVLVNLAVNARDAMAEGGVLTLAAAAEKLSARAARAFAIPSGLYIRLTVSDTGTGMDGATLARACEPFFTTKPRDRGTGLGLSMAKSFAEQSDGALAIESRSGSGTTVTLWLRTAEAEPMPAISTPGQITVAGPVRRVLLVDDEIAIRRALAISVQDAGFAALTAANGAEALALLDNDEAVDVLVTDLFMPGMSGLALIEQARTKCPGLPAILLTGYAGDDVQLAMSGALSGAFSLLAKPINDAQLVARIAVLLATRVTQAD